MDDTYIVLGDDVEELFTIAQEEMLDMYHPFVGTEHFVLAYLKVYGNKYITYDRFKKSILKIVGKSYKKSEYILYTPKLRKIKNECHNIYEALVKILTDDDSIAYNILLSSGEDIEKIYLNIINTNN